MKKYIQLLLFVSLVFISGEALAERYLLRHSKWIDTVDIKDSKFCRYNNDCASVKFKGKDKIKVYWDKYPPEEFAYDKLNNEWVFVNGIFNVIDEEYEQFVYSIEEPYVKLNPYHKTPLAALIKFPTDEETKISIRIKGKNGAPDIVQGFEGYRKEHEIPVFGLFPNHDNQVILRARNKKGDSIVSKITIPVGNVSFESQWIPVLKNDKNFHYYGSTNGYVCDELGNLRYIFNEAGYHLKHFKNNAVYIDHPYGVRKYSMLGKLIKDYKFPKGFYTYAHGMGWKDNGNLLVIGSFEGSKALFGSRVDETHRDFVLEIDKDSGLVLAQYDLAEMLNPDRSLIVKSAELDSGKVDWAHINGVDYNADDKAVIASGRHFGIVKIDEKTKKPVWWLTPHQLTHKSGRNGDKGDVSHLLLTAVDKNGKPYSKDVQQGIKQAKGFKWPLKTHSVRYVGEGIYSIFDNSGSMYDKRLYTTKNSYASVFKINDEQKTVQQIFLKGLTSYSDMGSIVTVHPKTKDIWAFASHVANINDKNVYNGKVYRFDKFGNLVYKAILSRRDNGWDYSIHPYEFYK